MATHGKQQTAGPTSRSAGVLHVWEEHFDHEAAVRLRALARLERAQLGTERVPIDPLNVPDDLTAHLMVSDQFGTAIGCGALVVADAGVFEIHRFYIRFDARRSGAGGVLLDALERAAVERGGSAVVVETSSSLPDTVRFFHKHGYQQIAPWGRYATRPTSVCFSKVF
jgi:GNAT superfamily N-acetyltransferase